MSLYEGKKAHRAITDFNADALAGPSAAIWAAETLKQGRRLAAKHLDAVCEECIRISDAAHLKIWEQLEDKTAGGVLRGRVVDHRLVYGAPVPGDLQLYRFFALHMAASQEFMTFSQRALPVALESNHVEERYLDRVARFVKNPESREPHEKQQFMGSLVIASTIAMVMTRALEPQVGMTWSIYIPDQYGAYLGFMERVRAEDQMHATTQVFATQGNLAVSGDYEGIGRQKPVAALSDVKVYVHAKTFIGLPDMFDCQRKLHAAFEPLLVQASQPNFVAQFIRHYTAGTLGGANRFSLEFGKFCDSVVAIIGSQAWDAELVRARPALLAFLNRRDGAATANATNPTPSAISRPDPISPS